MADSKKKSGEAAPKKAAAPAAPISQSDVVKVKNTTDGVINTSKGMIVAGGEGEATISELRQLNHFLEKI